jgi:PAS domain S-box-containing protein
MIMRHLHKILILRLLTLNKNKIINFILIIATIYFLPNQSHGQSNLALKHQIESIDSLNDLSRNYAFVDNVLALRLANEALANSLSVNYMEGQAFAFRNMSSVFAEQFLFDESITYIKLALNIFEDLKDQEGIANCNISLGHTFSKLGQDSIAYLFHQKAYDFFQSSNNTERMAITSHNLGHVFLTRSDRFNAKKYFLKALKYAQELQNHQLSSSCLSYLGQIEFESNNFESAQAYFIKSRDLFYQLGAVAQKNASVSTFYHLAMIKKINRHFDEMLVELESATKIISKFEVNFYVNEVYEEIISYHRMQNDLSKVDFYTTQFVKILKNLNQKNLEDKTLIYIDFIKSYDLKKKYDEKVESYEINEKIIEANSNVIKILIVLSLCLTGLLIVIGYQFFLNKRNTDSIRSIFENAGTAIILLDEGGEIIKWNKSSNELFDELSDKVSGKKFFEEFVMKQNNLKPEDLENLLLNDLKIITSKGKTKEISVSCFKTFINDRQYFVLFILDTSEIKRLKRLNKFYLKILEKSNEIAKIGTWEILFSKFLNKEMPIMSSKTKKILELEEVTGDTLNNISWTSFFKSEEFQNRLKGVFQESILAGQPFDIELELLTWKGNEIWVRLIGNVEQITNNDFRLYGTAQDITEIKNGIKLIEEDLAKELELNKLKSKFISMASHEFRTPLATIASSVELIKINLDKITAPFMEVFDRHTNGILNQIERLEDTLNGILLLEKTIQGKISIVINQVDLCKLLFDLVESVAIVGDPRKPVLNLNKTGIILNSDPYLLNHILQNIISNALKYSKGKQEPIIKAFELDKVVIIEVQDFGIGIPESDKSSLFNAFFRATNTAGIKGTGLGLSIVKEFVTLLKAEISIESQEGVGTKVTLTFPFNH